MPENEEKKKKRKSVIEKLITSEDLVFKELISSQDLATPRKKITQKKQKES